MPKEALRSWKVWDIERFKYNDSQREKFLEYDNSSVKPYGLTPLFTTFGELMQRVKICTKRQRKSSLCKRGAIANSEDC